MIEGFIAYVGETERIDTYAYLDRIWENPLKDTIVHCLGAW